MRGGVSRTDSLFPLVWFWRDLESGRMGLADWLRSRPFTAFYLFAIATILLLIGMGDTRSCSTAVHAFICSHAIWPDQLFSAPHLFALSLLTGPWFLHDTQHVLYVIAGFLVFVQSYEARAGTKATLIVTFGGTAVAATLVALALNLGQMQYPDSEIITDSMSRNWVGGSVMFYATVGGLAHFARTPWVILGSTGAFEMWNHFGNDIMWATNAAHILSLTFGFIAGFWLHGSRSSEHARESE